MTAATPSEHPDRTRFGSVAAPADAAAAVLRARAAAMGAELMPASPRDLAASVIGVDALMALTGAGTLERPARLGHAAVQVLAACLARAAGRGEEPATVPTVDCPTAGWLLALVDEHVRWAERLVPSDDVDSVLDAVAWDAWAAGEGTVFAAYAALLTVAKDA